MTKAENIQQVALWLESQSRCFVEIEGNTASICERRYPADEYPPPELMSKMRTLAKTARTEFSNVTATVEAVDEWADLRIQIL